MSKTMKRFAAVLLSIIMIFGAVMPVSAAGYGKTNAKASYISFTGKDGGDFIREKTKATIKFKMKKNCQVRVYVLDVNDKTIWYKDVSNVKANKTYTVTWDGKKTNKKYAAGNKYYHVVVRAGSTKTTSDSLYMYSKVEFSGGVGSKSNPYQIATTKDFLNMKKHNKCHFIQTADLDFNLETIAPYEKAFYGVYDGNGHKISNVVFQSTTGSAAMFTIIKSGAVVTDLTFENCTAFSSNNDAAIVATTNEGTVSACKFNNITVKGDASCGSICAYNESSGKIIDCTVQTASIRGKMIGGFVRTNSGRMESLMGGDIDTGTKKDWYTESGSDGLVWYNTSSGIMRDCIATGISYEDHMARENGGIMQECYFNGQQNCYCNDGIIQ